MDLLGYVNHSGGAKGADTEWDVIGREFGVKTIHWRPEHLSSMSPEGRMQMVSAVKSAALALKRPTEFKGIELVQRNWFQVHHGLCVYAISHIIAPGEIDYKGFVNKTEKEIVSGGTGWAVEMAIQAGKSVFVFDLYEECWRNWMPAFNAFFAIEGSPLISSTFAGIGSRYITDNAKLAIRKAYQRTADYERSKNKT